ncbi:MAG: GNAT family N-acetyltransferase [Pseudomonadota bacterium]|nr:GNAT family N-acetyltransferase [Pseudomonadota bacterium]
MTLEVQRYRDGDGDAWNDFVRASKNGTFLFDRGYMDYHRDRFVDHSLVLRSDDGRVLALLPASEKDNALYSHAGLTYGGLILGNTTGSVAAIEMIEAIRGYLAGNGLAVLHYKTIPSIYHQQPAEEDRYALFRAGAVLARRDVLSVIPREARIKYQERRARGVRSANKAGAEVTESQDFAAFWSVLEDTLRERFGVMPVHSLEEITLLHRRFPASIRLFEARVDGLPAAGCVIFETERVAHVQYIAAIDSGRKVSALDAVFDHLLRNIYPDKHFFDFGISNEDAGRVLNKGLVEQKEGFGARTIVHDYYTLTA